MIASDLKSRPFEPVHQFAHDGAFCSVGSRPARNMDSRSSSRMPPFQFADDGHQFDLQLGVELLGQHGRQRVGVRAHPGRCWRTRSGCAAGVAARLASTARRAWAWRRQCARRSIAGRLAKAPQASPQCPRHAWIMASSSGGGVRRPADRGQWRPAAAAAMASVNSRLNSPGMSLVATLARVIGVMPVSMRAISHSAAARI